MRLVIRTGPRPTMNRRAESPTHPIAGRRRFTDADIITILAAGREQGSVADLCAAEGITLDTYQGWNAKYGGITLSQLKRARRRKRVSMIAAAALLVLATAYTAVATRTPAPGGATVSGAPKPARPSRGPAAAPAAAPAAGPVMANVVLADAAPATGPRPLTGTVGEAAHAPGTEAPQPVGYSVQVAALADLDTAQKLLEQLDREGYQGHVSKSGDASGLYRVRVGPIESRRAAEDVVQRLGLIGHQGTWITK